MKKNQIGLSILTVLLFSAQTGNAKSQIKDLNLCKEEIVDCTYSVGVYDDAGNVITGYSVWGTNIGGKDCLKALMAEVALLEYRYPKAIVKYELFPS